MHTLTSECFAQAYEAGRGKTVSFLVSRGFSEQAAEEAAQDAWVRGWERRTQLRDMRCTVPWVNRIAINIGRNNLRRESRFQELDERMESPAVLPDLRVAASVDVHRNLERCLPRDRVLLERRYFGDWRISELAREARATNRAVRIQLFRARQRFKALFEETRTNRPEWPRAAA